MIKIISKNNSCININKNEVYRYMGYHISDKSYPLNKKINKNVEKISQAVVCKACYDIFPLKFESNGILNLTFMTTDSKQLSKMLCNCNEIILFTATIGIAVDRLISKASRLSPADALIFQAAGTAAIESWCDMICDNFREQYAKSGKYLTPRFSPGYGDFPLNAQEKIFRVLNCPKNIGVSLTDSLLMIPTKSVSAIIGISDREIIHFSNKCKLCENTECKFRKE